MNTDLTPAEQAILGEFYRQLGLALRRIVGLEASAPVVNLPQAVPAASANPASTATPCVENLNHERTRSMETNPNFLQEVPTSPEELRRKIEEIICDVSARQRETSQKAAVVRAGPYERVSRIMVGRKVTASASRLIKPRSTPVHRVGRSFERMRTLISAAKRQTAGPSTAHQRRQGRTNRCGGRPPARSVIPQSGIAAQVYPAVTALPRSTGQRHRAHRHG